MTQKNLVPINSNSYGYTTCQMLSFSESILNRRIPMMTLQGASVLYGINEIRGLLFKIGAPQTPHRTSLGQTLMGLLNAFVIFPLAFQGIAYEMRKAYLTGCDPVYIAKIDGSQSKATEQNLYEAMKRVRNYYEHVLDQPLPKNLATAWREM